ncbi:hypothetical protein [Mesorhizobium sp. M1A.F.Ca.ET.072.01.1.1]|uniref:cold-shock protein n=1 Tax=Mesorhizobium sp. M1A.F.Ca.ET.072.01.1.1 TaxID=2496753 RepID=UPI001FE10F6E|nr:hypothetical protein [Mesorhizobium sp. M1A.F.Ca.ET.072.01.1.1]
MSRKVAKGLKPVEAAHQALKRLSGAFALAIMFKGDEDLIVGARNGRCSHKGQSSCCAFTAGIVQVIFLLAIRGPCDFSFLLRLSPSQNVNWLGQTNTATETKEKCMATGTVKWFNSTKG